MATLNLLEGREFSKEVDLDSSQEATFPGVQDSQEIQKDQTKPEEIQPVAEEVESEVKLEEPKKEEIKSSHEFRRSSPWPIIAGVVGGLILILVIFFNPFSSSKDDPGGQTDPETIQEPGEQPPSQVSEDPVTQVETTEDVTKEEADPKTTEQPSLSASLDNQLRQSTAAASFFVDFISAIPSGVKLSFFRCSSDGYLAAVMSQSQTLFSDFESNLSNITSEDFSGTTTQEKQLGDMTVFVQQIRGSIPSSSKPLSAGGSLSDSDIQASLNAKAVQANLQIRQIEISPEISADNIRQIPVTVKFSGTLPSVELFLQDLLSSYQNIKLAKISITESSRDFSDNQVNSVLDLDVFSR